MKTEIAIQRLITRFSGGNAITPNDADRAALKSIVQNYNDSQSKINYSQEPFAKLFLFLYNEVITEREKDNSIKPVKILKNILSTPMDQLLQNIYTKLNGYRWDEVIREIKPDEFKGNLSDEEYIKIKNKIAGEHLDKLMEKSLSYDLIKSQLIGKINQLMNDYV